MDLVTKGKFGSAGQAIGVVDAATDKISFNQDQWRFNIPCKTGTQEQSI